MRVFFFTVVLLFAASSLVVAQSADGSSEDPLAASKPRYELRLSLPELSVLHSAALAGVKKYGGTADFRQTLLREEDSVLCQVTIDDPRLLEVWTYWMAERTADLVGSADLDRLDAEHKLALQLAKQLNAKLAELKKSPIWERSELSGKLVRSGDAVALESEKGSFALTGATAAALASLEGRSLRVRGIRKQRAQIEVESFLELRPNTLEIFVMSHCPYARQAEKGIIEALRAMPAAAIPPKLEVHYLFFPRPGNGGGFASLHGEREIEENLAQIVLRDHFPAIFLDYLLLRADADLSLPWRDLAARLGLGEKDLAFVADKIAGEGEALMTIEHAYAAENYRIFDGSPTFVWEGKLLPSLQSLPAFATVSSIPALCSAGPQ